MRTELIERLLKEETDDRLRRQIATDIACAKNSRRTTQKDYTLNTLNLYIDFQEKLVKVEDEFTNDEGNFDYAVMSLVDFCKLLE